MQLLPGDGEALAEVRPMTAARLRIPSQEELVPVYYPAPVRWGRCGACGSTVWSLGRSGNEADAAMMAHQAFCRGGVA